MIYIKKVEIIQLFQYKSIIFDLFLIKVKKIDHFDMIRTCFNQICCSELKSGFKFGSKKLIKRQFDNHIKQNLALDRLDRQSLFNTSIFWTSFQE